MGNFIKYTDTPIFANFTSEAADPSTLDASYLFAVSQASLSFNTNLAGNRYLGKIQKKNDFSVTGPLVGKLSLTFFPLIDVSQSTLNVQSANQLAFFDLTGNFTSGHNIKLSNFMLKRTFLDNYSIKIAAYQPVSITANFSAYDIREITATTLVAYPSAAPNIAKDPTKPFYKSLHGLSTVMDGSLDNLPRTKTNIDISTDTQRTAIYSLGSKMPDSVVLTSLERTTTIQGENIGNVVDVTGSNPGATNIYFQTLDSTSAASNSSYVLKLDIDGRIITQDISVSQGAILNGKVVIKEIIL